MIEYNEAIKVLEKNIEQQKKTEEIHILDSYGYIVAEDIYSSISSGFIEPQFLRTILFCFFISFLFSSEISSFSTTLPPSI